MSKQDYFRLEYPIRIVKDETGTLLVEIPDLPGCMTVVEDFKDADAAIEKVKEGWIELALEDGQEIPLPSTERQYSGKFSLRIPSRLHEELAEQARENRTSLNQWCIHLLSRSEKAVETEEMLRSLNAKVDRLTTSKSTPSVEDLSPLLNFIQGAALLGGKRRDPW